MHLLTDQLLLRSLGVASCLDLGLVALGESDGEHSEHVAIEGLRLNEGLDERVPLLDQSAGLIAGDVHTVEVGVAVVAFNFFALDLHFSPGVLVSLAVEIGKRDLENATLEGVGRNFYVSQTRRKNVFLLWPAVLLQGVMVGFLLSKVLGTSTLYHSFLTKGWELQRLVSAKSVSRTWARRSV